MERFRNLVKALIPSSVFRLIEPYGHLGEAILANLRYGFPGLGLKVIGVTGTDGKTTTSTLIASMLKSAGFKVGLITTISIDTGHGAEPNPTRLTSVKAFELQKQLRRVRSFGSDWLVLETTSHALAQNRYFGIPYHLAVMTSLTHEHLDYHRTFERYRLAKLRLFQLVAQNRRGLRAGVVNADDPSAELFSRAVPKAITYGLKGGDLKAEQIKSTPAGSSFQVKSKDRQLNLRVNLPCSFNVYNALAAAGVGVALDLSGSQIESGIASLKTVEGRMNSIDEGQDFAVIVDYAHTPESFEKVFSELKPVTKGRMVCLFGSAGRRDQAKRAIQGQVAGKHCDVVVVTEEDDRDEDGKAILEEIGGGAEQSGKVRNQDLFLIHDRNVAIEKAIGLAQPGDTVLLLGKGHEKSILSNDGKKPWDEAAEARKAIRAKLSA